MSNCNKEKKRNCKCFIRCKNMLYRYKYMCCGLLFVVVIFFICWGIRAYSPTVMYMNNSFIATIKFLFITENGKFRWELCGGLGFLLTFIYKAETDRMKMNIEIRLKKKYDDYECLKLLMKDFNLAKRNYKSAHQDFSDTLSRYSHESKQHVMRSPGQDTEYKSIQSSSRNLKVIVEELGVFYNNNIESNVDSNTRKDNVDSNTRKDNVDSNIRKDNVDSNTIKDCTCKLSGYLEESLIIVPKLMGSYDIENNKEFENTSGQIEQYLDDLMNNLKSYSDVLWSDISDLSNYNDKKD